MNAMIQVASGLGWRYHVTKRVSNGKAYGSFLLVQLCRSMAYDSSYFLVFLVFTSGMIISIKRNGSK